MNKSDDHPTMEFSIGETVTFKPYEHAYERVVANYTWSHGVHNQLLYVLKRKDSPGKRGSNHTSGVCIKESKYYVPWEESEDFRRVARTTD